MGSIRNKNNWNNTSKRLFGSYSHSGIPGFHSGYSAPRSRIAGIYSGIFPNEHALNIAHTYMKRETRFYILTRISLLCLLGSSALVFTKILKEVHENHTQEQNHENKHLHPQNVLLIVGVLMTSLGW